MSTNENRSTVGRRRLMQGGLLATASALTMLVATPASADSAPTAPTNLRPVFVDGVLKSIAWDASVSSSHVSYILYLNGPLGRSTVTQTSKTSRTVRELVYVDCLHTGATLHLSVRALASDHSLSGFSEVLEVTIPKTVPPRG
jgi:hypothetical protein